ncbi:TetR/AcrR family transcriptional regulator [Conexibacter arvalis]|uniref:AcrR family transcriptional regulator n=1 Tax=Conexibacter arvalis TaxID=912552 RepID=A0A840IGI2_9ACTN|nr:TetR/AcrR family transcriptional regulator [Conexibacter arvalis]MBB4663351.1 AcrR family transcriptional regulator [Conexibacter arvalis]
MLPVTQRERLLDGMAQTVAAQGYAATSVADVLKIAGVSRRTFYERFSDKEDCFLAAYDAIVAVALERVRGACAEAPEPDLRLERGLDALLQVLAEEPAFARLGIVEVLAAGPRGLARRDETLRLFVGFIQDHREQLGDAGAPPSGLVSQAIVGGIYELLYSHIVRGEADRLPELNADMLHYTFMLLGMERPTV